MYIMMYIVANTPWTDLDTTPERRLTRYSVVLFRARTVPAKAPDSSSPRTAMRSERIMPTMLSAILASEICSHGVYAEPFRYSALPA